MVTIKEDYPYFIEKVSCDENFTNLLLKLFNKGYKWLNGQSTDIRFVKHTSGYPLFISNLPFVEHYEVDGRRIRFKEYHNNILFISEDKNNFNLLILRKYKLKKLSNFNI